MPITALQYAQFSPFFVSDPKLTGPEWDNFNNKVESLPSALKDAILSLKAAEVIESVGSSNGLKDEQIEELSKITRDVIIAKLFIGDMPSQIAVQVGVDSIKARDIANKIVNQLFVPVLEDLKRVQKDRFGNKMDQFGRSGPEDLQARMGNQQNIPVPPQQMPPKPASPTPPQMQRPSSPSQSPPTVKPGPDFKVPAGSSGMGQSSNQDTKNIPPDLPIKPQSQIPDKSTSPSPLSSKPPTENKSFDKAQDKLKQYNVINLKDL